MIDRYSKNEKNTKNEVHKIVAGLKNIPNMILIGSTSRNNGKTTLAVSIINKLKLDQLVVALKVTTIEGKNGKCIRGGEGCGVCSSFKGNYEITEEISPVGSKDTAVLLAAGADKVYWLKTLKSHIDKGIESFISNIPKNAVIVCESNSLRKFVQPGIFIMLNNSENSQIKKSAMDVIDHADIILENNFSGNFERKMIKIENKMSLKQIQKM